MKTKGIFQATTSDTGCGVDSEADMGNTILTTQDTFTQPPKLKPPGANIQRQKKMQA